MNQDQNNETRAFLQRRIDYQVERYHKCTTEAEREEVEAYVDRMIDSHVIDFFPQKRWQRAISW